MSLLREEERRLLLDMLARLQANAFRKGGRIDQIVVMPLDRVRPKANHLLINSP